MKILLLNPPFQRLKGLANLYFPLGLGYLAAVAAAEGFEVKIYDAEIPQKGEGGKSVDDISLLGAHHKFLQILNEAQLPIWREISEVLNTYQPDVVGISLLTPLYGSARKITLLCKEYNDKCKVVWGGTHPTLMAQEVLEEERGVDFVVRGEGEETFKELLYQLDNGSEVFEQIDGLSYRCEGKIKHNAQRELIKNPDDIPFPGRDLLLNTDFDNRIFRNIMGSRGCPYDCAYCSSSQFWHRKVRFRSVSDIIREIKHLQDNYHITELEFWDDTFTLNRKRTVELCEALITEKLNIRWWCNTRADFIDEELLGLMKRSGCDAIHIGVETGSERTLAYLNRKLSLEDIKAGAKLLSKSGINWNAYFMIGFPYETVEDINETRKLMRSLDASGVQLSIFTPYPKTSLYEICAREGLIADKPDWSRYSHQSPENHFVKNISKEEFEKIVKETAEDFDRANKSFRTRLRRVMARKDYYLSNPGIFFKKLMGKINF